MKYWAFLSYSHTDKKWGDWLHKALETYRVPRRLIGKESRDGKVPERVYPIFRDREELPVSADLGSNINEALSESRYLIVICSPRSAQSRWVGEEIKTYKQLGREDRILALIVDGEPNASDGKSDFKVEDECFPEAMRYHVGPGSALSPQRTEPIAADAREGKDGKANAKLKLLAGLLGVNYDDLKQRDNERRIRRLRSIVIAALIMVSGFGALSIYAWLQKQAAQATLSTSDFLQALRSIDEDKDSDAVAQLARSLSLNPRNAAAVCRLTTLLTYHSFAFPLLQLKHDRVIECAQFSPDARRIVTASRDNSARVWDVQSGKQLTPPLNHDGQVYSAQFSPNGEWIVTASADKTARIWDARSGQPIGEPLQHNKVVNSVQFSSDAKRILTTSGDTAWVWDTKSGKPTAHLELGWFVCSAQFSPDGNQIVTASGDSAQVWNAESGKPITPPLRHVETAETAEVPYARPVGLPLVMSAQFSPDGKWIATASAGDKTARVWDAKSGKPITEPLRHDDDVWSAQFSPDGNRIVTASSDRTARVWDVQSGRLITQPLKHGCKVMSAQFSPNGKEIVTTSEEKTARVWDAQTGEPLTEPMHHNDIVISARFSADGRRILTVGGTSARVWDSRSGKSITESVKHHGAVLSAQFNPNGEWIVTASADTTARVWDARTGKPITGPLHHDDVVNSAELSPNGKEIVTSSADQTARIWDAQSGKPLTQPLKHDAPVDWAQFSPNGKELLTQTVTAACVWDAESGKPLNEVGRHDSLATSPNDRLIILMSAHLSPNGEQIVTATSDETTRVWDAKSGKPLTEPLKHDGTVLSARFSPDGKRIVTASSDKTARIWDIWPASKTVPDWLPRLAEAMAGQHLNDQSVFDVVSEDSIKMINTIREQLAKAPADDDWAIWGRWFLADRSTRTISPFSKITIPDYIENRIKENTAKSLDEAEQLAVGNMELLKRIALTRESLPKTAKPNLNPK